MTVVVHQEETLLQVLAELEVSGAINPDGKPGLQLPENLSFDRYEALFLAMGTLNDRTRFYLGDLLNHGEKAFPDRYAQAVEATGLRYETLMNYSSVMGRVARSRRRIELSFGHHAAVAKLGPEEQSEWLEKAATSGWDRATLRQKLKDAGKTESKVEQPAWSKLPDPNEPVAHVVSVREDAQGLVLELDRPLEIAQTPGGMGHPVVRIEVTGEPAELAAASGFSPSSEEAKQEPEVEGDSELRAAVRRMVEDAHLIEVPDDRDEEGNALVGIVLRDPIYGISREAFDEVAALAGEE